MDINTGTVRITDGVKGITVRHTGTVKVGKSFSLIFRLKKFIKVNIRYNSLPNYEKDKWFDKDFPRLAPIFASPVSVDEIVISSVP